MEIVPVENHVNLRPDAFEPIRLVLETHRTMERALAWFFVPERLRWRLKI